MAKAITTIEKQVPSAAEEQEQAAQELLAAAAKHKDALLTFFDILGELQEAGALEMAHAAVKQRHKIGAIGINQLNKSGAQNMIKNGMGAVQFLSQLDPNKLQTILDAVAGGVDNAVETDAQHKKPLGLWDMFKQMRDPKVNSSLGLLFGFLRGMGGRLQQKGRM